MSAGLRSVNAPTKVNNPPKVSAPPKVNAPPKVGQENGLHLGSGERVRTLYWSLLGQQKMLPACGMGESRSGLISHKVFEKLFCKSQFPHKSVNFFFILVIVKDKLTDLWES